MSLRHRRNCLMVPESTLTKVLIKDSLIVILKSTSPIVGTENRVGFLYTHDNQTINN